MRQRERESVCAVTVRGRKKALKGAEVTFDVVAALGAEAPVERRGKG